MSRVSKGGWSLVKECFIPHPEKEGFLTHKRLLEEMQKQRSWSKKSSIGGKKSAAKRAEKQKHFKGGSKMVATKSNVASASATASAVREVVYNKEESLSSGSLAVDENPFDEEVA